MLIGYNFEPRPNSRALDVVGSVKLSYDSTINDASTRKTSLTRENKVDYLVQKFGMQRLQRLDAILETAPRVVSTSYNPQICHNL